MKQVISIFLSLLLLASSSGVTYAQHYCGDYEMMSKVTLGESYLSCGMAMETPACDDEKIEAPSCCENQFTQVSTDDNFAKASFKVDFDTSFVAALVTIFVVKELSLENPKANYYSTYNPPPLIKDIPVLYDTFLI